MNQPHAGNRNLLPLYLYSYTFMTHILLGAIIFWLYRDKVDANIMGQLTPSGSLTTIHLVIYTIGFLAFGGALVLPAKLGQVVFKATANQQDDRNMQGRLFAPYMLRLMLLETCSVAGFALAFLEESPALMLPFVIIAGGATLMSPPTEDFMRRTAGANS